MHRQRIIERRLHDEAIEDGAVIAVIIETVDQPLIELGLFGLRAPDDPLMMIGNADAVILVVIGEEELILRLGQVINGAWIDRIEDFLFEQIFAGIDRSEEHTTDLHSLMRTSYDVSCLKKNNK